MAGRIKGITVEIGGDTTGLDKAYDQNHTVLVEGREQTPETRSRQY